MGNRELRKPKKAELLPVKLSGNSGLPLSPSANQVASEYPVFCLRHLYRGFTINDCDKVQKACLVEKLSRMAQCSWYQLETGSHWTGAGFEKLPKSSMNVGLPSIVTDDVGKLHSMRFGGSKYRLIGIRSGGVFHITHVDVELKAYPHGS